MQAAGHPEAPRIPHPLLLSSFRAPCFLFQFLEPDLTSLLRCLRHQWRPGLLTFLSLPSPFSVALCCVPAPCC
uniref:Uncharacterized protein n=1 Tax=Arundo donax TaxID=35708 RepID=A0A0A9EF74_ARUDO